MNKRIYTTLVLLTALVTGVFAQRHCDVKVLTIVGPENNFAYPCKGLVHSGYIMINLGPDTILYTDTLMITDPNNDNTAVDPGYFAYYRAFPYGSVVTNGGQILPTYDIAPGDTILNYQWEDSARRLSSIINADEPIIYDPQLNDSVFNFVYTPAGELPPNGNYYWMVRMIGFTDSTKVKDTVISNNALINKFTLNCETDIYDVKYKNISLIVYPNPSSNTISFKYSSLKATNVNAKILDLTGRTIKTNNFGKTAPGDREFEMNIDELPSGTYLLEFTTDDTKGISKFTKQ